MATIKPLYGTEDVTLTITLASLANNSWRSSAYVDNTVNLFLDAIVQVQIKSGSAATGPVKIYIYATADFAGGAPAGPIYPEGINGTDQTITPQTTPNLALGYTLNVAAASTIYVSNPFSVATVLNVPMLPSHWGIAIQNTTGAALDATASNHAVLYQGIQAQSV